MYDVAVIGAGMIGSAAAKHAAKSNPGLSVCLVGPPEETDKTNGKIFGCWFDEGRLFDLLHTEPIWGHLALEAILRYEEIKEESGIDFYEEKGYLGCATPISDSFDDHVKYGRAIKNPDLGIDCLELDEIQTQKHLPFLKFPRDSKIFYQPPNNRGGALSPRQLVRAQQVIAEKNGCKLFPYIVEKIETFTDDSYGIQCEGGRYIRAKKILLSTGTYTGLLPLLTQASKGMFKLNMTYTAQVLALMEVDDKEADRLKLMPTMVTQFHPVAYTYILPPIKYPNGKTYIKFGAHDRDKNLTTLDMITDYFRNGPDPAKVKILVDFAKDLIPGLRIQSVESNSCVTSNTPGKKAPYIDKIPGTNVVVAAGGCGHAATSSDEIGRLAAKLLIQETWDSKKVPRESCKASLTMLNKL